MMTRAENQPERGIVPSVCAALTWVSLLVLAAAGCGSTAAATSAPRAPREVRSIPRRVTLATERLELPLREDDPGRLVVELQVPREPGSEIAAHRLALLVDTGASVLALRPATALRLSLASRADRVLLRGASSERWQEVNGGRIEQIIAGTAGQRAALVIDDVSWFSADVGAADGLVGIAVFEPLTVTIDGPGLRFVVSRESLSRTARDVFAYQMEAGVPVATVDAAGLALRVRIDSGSNTDLKVPPEIASRLRLVDEPSAAAVSVDIHGERQVLARRLEGSLTFGGIVVQRPRVIIDAGPPSLGAGVLSRGVVTFDTAQHLLRAR